MNYFAPNNNYNNNNIQNNNGQNINNINRTFRDEYTGVINGLMSGVQLGYASVSMIYFYKSVKKIITKICAKLFPIFKKIYNKIDLKLLGLYFYAKIIKMFKIQGGRNFVIKSIVFFCLAGIVKIFYDLKKEEATLKRRKYENKILFEKTSEEFWKENFKNF